MAQRRSKSSPRRASRPGGRSILLRAVLCAGILGLTAVIVYGLYLAASIEIRFSGRKWSLPSTVYSDAMLLFPGQRLGIAAVRCRLDSLGYRCDPALTGPLPPGHYHAGADTITVHLRATNRPGSTIPALSARIDFHAGAIAAIVDTHHRKQLDLLELDPVELTRFYGPERERRHLVSIDRVPQHLIHAVLAAEDRRFYSHPGIDPAGIARALLVNLRSGGIRAGGSTITQQLAKCYFLSPERTLRRKARELLMALAMELMYTKNEILEMYLNEIYLGQRGSISINGVGEAARHYFGKEAEALTPAEAATIAGLIKAPNRYAPLTHPDRCRARRGQVLHLMADNGWLTPPALQQALEAPVETDAPGPSQDPGGYLIDYVARQLVDLYSPEDLRSLGLSIYTTIDPIVQEAAETSLREGLLRLETANPALRRPGAHQCLQGSVVVLQPRTGALLALVGGRDYSQSQFDRATQARRQPGSAFKPIVYAAALDSCTPATVLSNQPLTCTLSGQPWTPHNFAPIAADTLLLRRALALSANIPTVALALQTGLGKIVTTARQMGITTPLAPFPSLALGAFEVVPLELARACCCFAADGMLPYPLVVREVSDAAGAVLNRRHTAITQAMSPARAFVMSSLLRSVVTEGTARALADLGIHFPAAGKTGTTDDFRDAWFVGYTPDVLALVWVGFDDGTSIQASGAQAALPIWAALMQRIPHLLSGTWFAPPPGVVTRTICLQSGARYRAGACPQKREEYFLEGTAPETYCRVHGGRTAIGTIMKGIRDAFR